MRLFQLIGPYDMDLWFRIEPVSLESPFDFHVDAAHIWGLPGVRQCSGCGRSWAGRLPLPGLDLTGFAEEARLRKGWVADVDELRRLADGIRTFAGNRLSPEIELGPGTYFGPLKGTARGRTRASFVFIFNETVLVNGNTFTALQSAGVRGLVGILPQIQHKRTRAPVTDLLELHVEPCAHLVNACVTKRSTACALCSHHGVTSVRDPMIIRRDSVPADRDLFRVAEWWQHVVVTETFRNAVEDNNLTGVKFLELNVE